jgi:hemerythrin superfamily protein
MKVTDILQEQHSEIRALFKRITAPNEAHDRPALLDRLLGELQIHTRLEEAIFYPAVRELDTKKAEETVFESIEEHNIVDFLVAQLPGMDLRGERFLARVRVLQSIVDEHVNEEEDQMFQQAEKLGQEELDRLGAVMLTQIAEIQRVNVLVTRMADAITRVERSAGRVLDATVGLPRRVASRLAPSRLLAIDQRAMWVAAIAATTPQWLVDGAYDLLAGSVGGRPHVNGKRIAVESGGIQPELAA